MSTIKGEGPGAVAATVREGVSSGCHTGTQGAFYRDWRLIAIDGTTFDLPDMKANVEAFGRPPRSGRGEQDVSYRQLRMVGLVECGTHAVFDAAIGALRTGEQALARAVLGSLRPGMLLLADRGFYSVDLWRTAAATGADLLWRVRKDLVLPVVEQLSLMAGDGVLHRTYWHPAAGVVDVAAVEDLSEIGTVRASTANMTRGLTTPSPAWRDSLGLAA
ncbi:transposase [Streptomyces sp. NPDC048191]|uniref:transposase n=1 Tax=Streptomyces sp. NPDC048191 TaxID=3155484 RepID=UPI00340E0AC8